MPSFRREQGVPVGVYDEVVSEELARRLESLLPGQAEHSELRRDSEVEEQLVSLIRDAARIAIGARSNAFDRLELAQRTLASLQAETGLSPEELRLQPRLLRRVLPVVHGAAEGAFEHPRGSLLSSSLISNAHGESVLDHLASEFPSADRVDLLCSFIKLSGLDRLRRLIEAHRSRGRKFRVLTTTYMRATELKAVEVLHRLGAEVRISYDDSNTRLHAKAWLFHRQSRYSTAYVGSSNLSHAAQTDGLEWNVRVAQAEQPELVEEMANLFESYWRDADKFHPFDGSQECVNRLQRALTEPERTAGLLSLEVEPRDWQLPILRELETARAYGRHRNLVVAATGTGKTLIAAFDFERLFRSRAVETLLFVAHRREILEQSRSAFRQVLRMPHFGELWVDGQRPSEFRHVFASIQSLQSEGLDPRHYHHVVVDEVHHAAARTYAELLDRLQPRELVGLTATPERSDGRLYDRHFPPPFIGNLRIWNAIPYPLVPFRYFVLDAEGVDLSDVSWVNGGYVDSELSDRLIRSADVWVRTLVRAIKEHIARPHTVRALAFCVDKAHAREVARRLTNEAGLVAACLTDETPRAERNRAKEELSSGKVQVLCVVDLFNEGVDIPDVNTLFLFRPTESATVFLQQIGRGLRRSRDKDILTILDLTGRQHPKFRFDRHLRGLLGHTPRELRAFVQTGQGRLPSGCVVHFEERSQEELLERLQRAIPTSFRDLKEVLSGHREHGWSLQQFIEETEVDLFDLYRSDRSWTSLKSEVGLAKMPDSEAELDALSNVQKLIEVNDPLRLELWKKLLRLEQPQSERERRLAAMLFVVLYGTETTDLSSRFERWAKHDILRAELAELLPVLETRIDAQPGPSALDPEIPLSMHGRYSGSELSAAFAATTKDGSQFRQFFTGVEKVCRGRYDLLLVTMEKSDVEHEHLRYKDFAMSETEFHWQSQADTRQNDPRGQRHVDPERAKVTPLLFVRETKKDARGVTAAFRYLGPVAPTNVRGERPISIEWKLRTPLRSEWVRKWGNVA
jgi:superfamily II DNA or RNA helicase/HKD family nuclease